MRDTAHTDYVLTVFTFLPTPGDKKLAKQQSKLDKKQNVSAPAAPTKTENKVESSSKSTDKVNSIEDRIHE